MKNFLKSIACLIFYFAVQFIMQMVFMLFGVVSGIQSESGLMEFSMNHLLLMVILSNMVTIILLALLLKFHKKCIKEEWSLVPTKIRICISPSISAFLLSFAWALVTYNLSFANAKQIEKSAAFYSNIFSGLGVIMMALTLLVVQPVMEEILCRGIILNKLKNSMPEWTAVLLSSLLFGIIHLMAGGLWLTIGAAVMGVYFGIVFVKTKSLYAAILAHSFANLPDFIMSYLPKLEFVARIALASVCAALSFIIMILFMKMQK